MKQLHLFLALLLAYSPALPVHAQVINSAANVSGASAPTVPALNFGLSREQMRDTYRTAAATLDGALKGIASVPVPQANFANIVLAQEKALGDFVRAAIPLTFTAHVSPLRSSV